MPITVNESGVLKTLDTIHVNENGVLKKLDTVHANENGVLKEIYSGLPTSLTWHILNNPDNPWGVIFDSLDTTDTAIISSSNNGLSLTYTDLNITNTGSQVASYPSIYSDRISLKAGNVIHFEVLSLSGDGSTMTEAGLHIYDMAQNTSGYDTYYRYAYGYINILSEAINSDPSNAKGSWTIEKDGEYVLTLSGSSWTGGQTFKYYKTTVSANISFS